MHLRSLMMPNKWSCLYLLLAANILLSSCHPSSALKTTVRTSNFKFGVVDNAGVVVDTAKIPYKWGTTYGWNVNVEPKDQEVHWKEVITKPAVQVEGDANKFSNQTTVEKDEMPKNGAIANVNAVAPGDPKGKYTMTIYINDRVVDNLSYELK